MKFRDPKTGEVFDGVVAFRGSFCCQYNCENCPIMKAGKTAFCEKWIAEHPHEAARLMGYEVIEDVTDTNVGDKPIENEGVKLGEIDHVADPGKKPLKDWTLGEVQRMCDQKRSGQSNPCPDCRFSFDSVCVFETNWPDRWCLTEKPRWMAQEIEDAKAIRRLFPWIATIRRVNGNVYIGEKVIEQTRFPSLAPGQTATLDEIIGGAE